MVEIDEAKKIFEAYNKGLKAKQDHTTPSPLTLELFKNMDEKIDKLSSKIEDLFIKIAELPEKILEKADNRYAGKEFENDVNSLKNDRQWVVRLIIGVLIMQLLVMIGLKYV